MDFCKSGYLASSISDFMAQKWQIFGHFMAQIGPDSRTLSGHDLVQLNKQMYKMQVHQ